MITAAVIQLCLVFGITLIICDIGHRVNGLFDQTIATINQFDWYLIPIKIRRLLPTLLIVAQQPVEIVVIGSISANRNTFKKVNFSQVNCIE